MKTTPFEADRVFDPPAPVKSSIAICGSGHDVPLVITNWLAEALARREKGERVLVALLESGSAGSPQPSLAEACLHRIARKAKADFLFHAEPVQAGQRNSDFPMIPGRQILIGDSVPIRLHQSIQIRRRTNFKTVKSATQASEAAASSRHESVCPDSSGCPPRRAAESTGGGGKCHIALARLRALGRFLPVAGLVLTLLLATGCAHLAIDKKGTWTGPLPQPITVKEAARIEPPWYGKVVAPFFITLFSGSRVGMEYNEGRIVRTSEYIRGIPYAGMVVLPYFCYESLTRETMQGVANAKGIDKRRERKYEAIIQRLEQDGRTEEAAYLKGHSPFDPANHPPNPRARMPRENLRGTKGVIKTLWVELAIGHRNSLERDESRGVRKLEYWHPLILTRIYESFEAGAGRRMEDIAEKEHLDERWLPKPAKQAQLPDCIAEQPSAGVTAN